MQCRIGSVVGSAAVNKLIAWHSKQCPPIYGQTTNPTRSWGVSFLFWELYADQYFFLGFIDISSWLGETDFSAILHVSSKINYPRPSFAWNVHFTHASLLVFMNDVPDCRLTLLSARKLDCWTICTLFPFTSVVSSAYELSAFTWNARFRHVFEHHKHFRRVSFSALLSSFSPPTTGSSVFLRS